MIYEVSHQRRWDKYRELKTENGEFQQLPPGKCEYQSTVPTVPEWRKCGAERTSERQLLQ